MAIVLTIVKIILILLLVIACILAAVLFLPVNYEADLDIDEKQADVRVNWLLRLIRFRFHAGKPMEAVLSILFFKIDFMDPEAKQKRAKKRARKEGKKAAKEKRKYRKKRRKDEKHKRKDAAEAGSVYGKDVAETGSVCGKDIVETGSVCGKDIVEEENTFEKDDAPDGKPGAAAGKIGDAAGKVSDAVGKIGDMAGKASGAGKTAKRIIGLLQKYEVFEIVWPKLARFLNRIRPRVVTGCVAFGLEDPATTGKLVGALAMVPFLYQTDLRVVPDFETDETYVKGHIYTKGHMLLIWLVILAIGLFKEKNIRKFVGDIRHAREP